MPPALIYIVSFVVSLTQMAASDHLTSLEVCHQIRDNRIKILAMGSRGYRDGADKHWVYLLAEGGYLFVVPFTNLTVDPRRAKGNKLIIGGDYINASKLFNVTAENFTVKGTEQSRYQRFGFISSDQGQHFLMRMYNPSNNQGVCIKYYYLANGTQESLKCIEDEQLATKAHFLLSLDSTDKSPSHPDYGTRIEALAYEVSKDDMRVAHVFRGKHDTKIFNPPPTQAVNLSPPLSNTTTAFGLILNHSATLVFLTDSGKVIVAERKHLKVKDVNFVTSVRLPLSQFIECDANAGWAFYLEHYKLWIVLDASGTVLIMLICVWALCHYFKKKKNQEADTDQEAGTDRKSSKEKLHKKRDRKHKKKRRNKKSPATTTGANTSQAETSGPTSEIQTSINISSIASNISAKIKSLLTQSAKSTDKAKKSKVALSKKSKKSKANKKPSKA